jgi:hypothetical protein
MVPAKAAAAFEFNPEARLQGMHPSIALQTVEAVSSTKFS